LELLRQHGYLALFLVILVDQLGVPMPSMPLLLGAGALVGLGHLHPLPTLAAVAVGALLADLVWYELGRRKGPGVLSTLCRISLEPDSCVRQTEGVFDRYGDHCLLFAKFVPGLSTVTPPVAGLVGLPLLRFLTLDLGGILLWASAYGGLGALFSGQIEEILSNLQAWGATFLQLLTAGLLLYIAYKAWNRHRFLKDLRVARITPEQVHQMLQQNEAPFIVDLRSRLEHQHRAIFLPGAHWLSVDELQERHHELPRDRELVIYCS